MGRRRGQIRSSSRGSRRGRRVKDKEDRISQLSDDLITHILSYVHSRVAVQTSVLSKRWRNLWTTLSCLNFEIYFHNGKFLGKFLDNRDRQYVLTKFTISCYHRGGEMLTTCLDYALSHNVENLSISNGDLANYSYKVNFACLRTLHLLECRNSSMMDYWTLPSLTSLHLTTSRIRHRKFQFENLKELILVKISKISKIIPNEVTITINCPKLERLTLQLEFRHTFVVSAPSLSYLSYRCHHVSVFSVRDGFPCVKQVYIDIRKMKGDFFDLSDWPNCSVRKLAMQNFISILKAVRETRFLELSSETIKGLRMVPNLSEYEHPSLRNLNLISLRGPGLLDLQPPGSTECVINYLLTNSVGAKIIKSRK